MRTVITKKEIPLKLHSEWVSSLNTAVRDSSITSQGSDWPPIWEAIWMVGWEIRTCHSERKHELWVISPALGNSDLPDIFSPWRSFHQMTLSWMISQLADQTNRWSLGLSYFEWPPASPIETVCQTTAKVIWQPLCGGIPFSEENGINWAKKMSLKNVGPIRNIRLFNLLSISSALFWGHNEKKKITIIIACVRESERYEYLCK